MVMRVPSWLAGAAPTVAIEFASQRVTVVSLGATGTRADLAGCGSEPLPSGAVVPALTGTNVVQPAVVADALRRALERAGLSSIRRAGLLVPDSVARVTLLPFDQVPPKQRDFDELIRWQLKKATPFPIEEAVVSHVVASVSGTGQTIAAVVARRDVISQYEAVATAAGIHAGIVDLASFNVMNAVTASTPGASTGDRLFVHLATEATTLAILRGAELMFYRHRTAVDSESLGALVHQTSMFHEDRLGGGSFSGVWLSGAGALGELAQREIEGRLSVPVQVVDISSLVSMRDRMPITPDVLDALAGPVGMLLRERKAA